MKRMTKILGITVIVAVIAVGFVGCEPEVVDYHHNYDHYGTIYAFGKVVEVVGVNAGTSKKKNNVKIKTEDFKAAVGKLVDAVGLIETHFPANGGEGAKFIAMIEHEGFAMIIKTGNAGIAADADKSMTVGVEYLLANDAMEIAGAIITKLDQNAFAKAIPVKSNGVFLANARDGLQKLNRHAIALNNKCVNALRSRAFA